MSTRQRSVIVLLVALAVSALSEWINLTRLVSLDPSVAVVVMTDISRLALTVAGFALVWLLFPDLGDRLSRDSGRFAIIVGGVIMVTFWLIAGIGMILHPSYQVEWWTKLLGELLGMLKFFGAILLALGVIVRFGIGESKP